MVLFVKLFLSVSYSSGTSAKGLSLPWKAGLLITVQTAGRDATYAEWLGKLMHECVSHFQTTYKTEDAIERPNLRRTSDPDQGQRHSL